MKSDLWPCADNNRPLESGVERKTEIVSDVGTVRVTLCQMLRRVLAAVTQKFKSFKMAETSTQLVANEVKKKVFSVICRCSTSSSTCGGGCDPPHCN